MRQKSSSWLKDHLRRLRPYECITFIPSFCFVLMIIRIEISIARKRSFLTSIASLPPCSTGSTNTPHRLASACIIRAWRFTALSTHTAATLSPSAGFLRSLQRMQKSSVKTSSLSECSFTASNPCLTITGSCDGLEL